MRGCSKTVRLLDGTAPSELQARLDGVAAVASEVRPLGTLLFRQEMALTWLYGSEQAAQGHDDDRAHLRSGARRYSWLVTTSRDRGAAVCTR